MRLDSVKNFFFDRVEILDRVEKMKFRALFKQAMLVRQIARRSMRSGGKNGKPSNPGEPPRYQGERLLKDKLFAVYDQFSKSQVIGPALLNGKARRNRGKTVPETLEFGGTIDVIEVARPDGTWVPAFTLPWAESRKMQRRVVSGYVEPRPYMAPAEQKARPMFAEQFRNQFRRAA